MIEIYVKVGFWKRFLARLIDLFIVFAISFAILFFFLEKVNNHWQFRQVSFFYIWVILTMILLFSFSVLLPILTRGYTIGFLITKIKVHSKNNNYFKTILLREVYFTFLWLFIMFLVLIFINHTLIFQISQIRNRVNNNDPLPNALSMWDQIRISFVGSISSIIFFIQIFIAMSIVGKKNNEGFHDTLAGAMVIKPHKTQEIQEKFARKLTPCKVHDKKVEWI